MKRKPTTPDDDTYMAEIDEMIGDILDTLEPRA